MTTQLPVNESILSWRRILSTSNRPERTIVSHLLAANQPTEYLAAEDLPGDRGLLSGSDMRPLQMACGHGAVRNSRSSRSSITLEAVTGQEPIDLFSLAGQIDVDDPHHSFIGCDGHMLFRGVSQ